MSHALVRALSNRLAIVVLMIAAVVWPVESDAAQLTLSWTDNSTNEDGFKIQRRSDSTGMFTEIATVGPNVVFYTASGLASATTYC